MAFSIVPVLLSRKSLNSGETIVETLVVNLTAPSGRVITDTATVSSWSFDPTSADNFGHSHNNRDLKTPRGRPDIRVSVAVMAHDSPKECVFPSKIRRSIVVAPGKREEYS
jgi:hypothetical protein